MINTVNNTSAISQAEYVSKEYLTKNEPDQKPAETGFVTVSLSQRAVGAQKLLSDLPPLTLDPKVHMQKAEVALKELMGRLGMSANTDVQIRSKGDGSFTVSGDHPLVTQIEEMLNDGSARDLRNSLIGAHNGTVIGHIGAAVEMAMRGADANPNMADFYYDWVRTVADGAKNSSFEVSFNRGELTGNLVDKNGQAYEIGSGLVLPT